MTAPKTPVASPALSLDTFRANSHHLYAELAWMAIAFALEWYYLQVYAIRLGATPAHLGVLTAGRALVLAVGVSLTQPWRRRFRNAVTALSAPLLSSRTLLYLGIALVPFLPSYQVDVMVGLVVLSAIPTGIAQGTFLGMLPEAVSKDRLATVIARRVTLLNALILLCMAPVGQALEWLPRPVNYQIGFGLAFVASMLSWWHIQRIKTPDSAPVETARRRVQVWRCRPFQRFIAVVLAINFSVFMVASIAQLQLVRGLKAGDAWISVLGMFEMGAGALFTFGLSRLIRQFGQRTLIIGATFATVCYPLILALTTTLPPVIIGTVLFGAGWFGLNVMLYNLLVDIVPAEDLAQYAATYQLLVNVALCCGPFVGIFLIENVMSIPAALLLIAGLRFGAGVLALAMRFSPEGEPVTPLAKAAEPG